MSEQQGDGADSGIGTTSEDGLYTPAPMAGVLPLPTLPPVAKLPGESGYEPQD